MCSTIISHKVFTAPDRPQWFWAWWVDSSASSLPSEQCSLYANNHSSAHANAQPCNAELRLEVRGKTKRQMSTDTKGFPGSCDSAEEATWGEDWSILWQQSGEVQGFVFVCGRRVDFWSLFMQPAPPLHYQLLTLAKRQGVCNMAEAWLRPRRASLVVSSRDLEHTLAVSVD